MEQPAFANTDVAAALNDELDRAEILPPEKMPANVVTMNSRVRFRDLHTDEEHVRTLVYPASLKDSHDQLSVMAPLGAALLGMHVGKQISGNCRTVKKRGLKCWNCCTSRKRRANTTVKRFSGRHPAALYVSNADSDQHGDQQQHVDFGMQRIAHLRQAAPGKHDPRNPRDHQQPQNVEIDVAQILRPAHLVPPQHDIHQRPDHRHRDRQRVGGADAILHVITMATQQRHGHHAAAHPSRVAMPPISGPPPHSVTVDSSARAGLIKTPAEQAVGDGHCHIDHKQPADHAVRQQRRGERAQRRADADEKISGTMVSRSRLPLRQLVSVA